MISHIANLQTSLSEKQAVITENSLPQSKIFNLIATLNNKQDVVGVNDLQINHIQNLGKWAQECKFKNMGRSRL